MRKSLALGLVASTLLVAPAAIPCGMPFGYEYRIEPTQNIIITHKAGIETYQFNPRFCGQAASFGLILPLPGTLTENPALGEPFLYSQLANIAAPQYQPVDVCGEGAGGGAGIPPGGYAGGGQEAGVTVINAGTVGVFDWTLLKADSTAAFTDWLDVNGYPYKAAATTAFDGYVKDGWYFVAFKITASATPPTIGAQICGDLGPIKLAFGSQVPVVPARITAAGGVSDASAERQQEWHLFVITAHDQQVAGPSAVTSSREFAGRLSSADLDSHAAVAMIASAGERLDEFLLSYLPSKLTADISFAQATADADYRRIIYTYRYVRCDAGSDGSGSSGAGGAGGASGSGGSVAGSGGASGNGGSVAGSGGASGNGGSVAGSGGSLPASGGNIPGSGGSQPGSGGTTVAITGGAPPAPAAPVGEDTGCGVSASPRNHIGLFALALAGAVLGIRRRRAGRETSHA